MNAAAYEPGVRGCYAFAARPPAPDRHSRLGTRPRKLRDVVVSPSCSPSGLVAATVAGAVTRADHRMLVNLVRAAIARFGTVRVLIRVQRYAGPHHDGRFDPDGLWDGADAEGISRIAVVGEPAWKTVLASGDRRKPPIEYFATEQAARRWLVERDIPAGWCPVPDVRRTKPRIPR